MLHRLSLADFGLIARADVEFAPGATIFTGETGSGKTMLIGAIDFVLGARAGMDLVRRGASRTRVSLTLDPDDALRERLCADGFELDPGEQACIEREMSRTGRSSLRINGRSATAAYVREMSAAIAEIVGQHEAQRLLSPAYHLELLDRFAGPPALLARAQVARAYERATELAAELERFREGERTARAQHDDARYALHEIESARVEPGEEERLNERRRYLENVGRIAAALQSAHDALAGDDTGATTALGAASAALSHVAGISAELGALCERSAVLQSEANDLAAEVSRALEAAEFDAGELEQVNARLDALDRLSRKYGGTLEGVRQALQDARRVVDQYESRDRQAAMLNAQVAGAAGELARSALTLSSLRRTAATALERRIAAEFAEIALGSGRFEAMLDPLERAGPDGAERVEFLFAANAGEPLRPLAKVASGGELSRVLLALVVALAGARGSAEALVFDEIDAGIGGATASAVGARIGQLARAGQVVCVTHLAQIATWADRHYVLGKNEAKNETTIFVREITGREEREAEIARMLSGESHDAALRHARALLEARATAAGKPA
jgi:DNA repair protein RecN (Recombination protein N)